jgi:tRNA G26 N,N-dimethylase Trm1
MEFRSKSCRDEKLQIESKVAPTSMQGLRSYSAKYVYNPNQTCNKDVKMKKVKSTSKSRSFINEAELQRKKRVAGYKIYDAEGKMKGSLRKSLKWIKNTYTQAIYGGWW